MSPYFFRDCPEQEGKDVRAPDYFAPTFCAPQESPLAHCGV